MSNPTMSDNIYENQQNTGTNVLPDDLMTVNGTILKTFLLTMLVIAGGAYTWGQFLNGKLELVSILMIAGIIVGFILSMIIIFAKKTAPYLSPFYAAAEGLALGGLSAQFEAQFPGIVFQAVTGTMISLLTMLLLYVSKIIKVTDKFRAVIFVATAAIALMYIISLILSLFHVQMPFLFDSSPLSIGISAVVVIIASLNFLLDFDVIEKGVASSMPKYFEWYCSFGILVTLVWVYVEILRLLAKLRRR